jgi:hypothetical protein
VLACNSRGDMPHVIEPGKRIECVFALQMRLSLSFLENGGINPKIMPTKYIKYTVTDGLRVFGGVEGFSEFNPIPCQ